MAQLALSVSKEDLIYMNKLKQRFSFNGYTLCLIAMQTISFVCHLLEKIVPLV